MDRGIRRFELCPAKKSPRPNRKEAMIIAHANHSNTRNHGCHRRPRRYPRAPRHRAQGARRAHAPRHHLQRCQGRAAQGTRGPSIPLSRKNIDSRRACDIFRRVAHRRARGGPRPARGTKSGPRRARIARAVSLRGVPLRAIPSRAPRDPRQARIRTGRVPAFAVSFPRALSLAFVDSRASCFSLFFAFRTKMSASSLPFSLRDARR